MMKKNNEAPLTAGKEWKRFLLLALIGLPIMTIGVICAYGFLMWFGQILFWGPPS